MSEQSIHDLTAKLVEVIDDTTRELAIMPFFARPMVKRSYLKRTGRSLESWATAAQALRARTARDALSRAVALGADPALHQDLARLADAYRTTPERAARAGMRAVAPAMHDRISVEAAQREAVVRALIAALDRLP